MPKILVVDDQRSVIGIVTKMDLIELLARRALAAERRFGDALHHERVLSKRLATPGRTAAGYAM